MKIKVIFWDVDGTLTDDQIHKAKHRFLAHAASYNLSEEEGINLNGVNDSQTYSYLAKKSATFLKCYPTVQDYLTTCQQFFESYAVNSQSEYHIKARQGAIELVRELALKNIKQACVTSAPLWQVKLNLAALRIDKMIEFTQALEDAMQPKPAPDLYELAFKKMLHVIPDLTKSEVLVIEDSLSGVNAAHAAGLQVIHCRMKESAPASDMTSLHAFKFEQVKALMIEKFNLPLQKHTSNQNIMKTILITGANGLMGLLLSHHLKKFYNIVGIDVKSPGQPSARFIMNQNENSSLLRSEYPGRFEILDFTNKDALQQFFVEVGKIDAVIHCGALLENAAPDKINEVNEQGTRNIFEVCFENHIQHVLFTSSLMLTRDSYSSTEPYRSIIHNTYTGDYQSIKEITEEDPIKLTAPAKNASVSAYRESKVVNEKVAKEFAENGLSIIGMRLGALNSQDTIPVDEPWAYCSHQAVCEFVELATRFLFTPEGSKPGLQMFHVCSENPNNWISLEKSKMLLGFHQQQQRADESHSSSAAVFQSSPGVESLPQRARIIDASLSATTHSNASARNSYNHNRFFGTKLSTQDLENYGEQVEEKAPNALQQQPQQKKTCCAIL